MAKNRWFGTWVLATLSLLGIRTGATLSFCRDVATYVSNMRGRHSRTQADAKTGRVWLRHPATNFI